MALSKCRECNAQISTEAEKCPHCGAPRPSGPTLGTVVKWVILTPILLFVAMCSWHMGTAMDQAGNAQDSASIAGEVKRNFPAAKDVQQSQSPQALGTIWQYREFTDELTNKPVKLATVRSQNTVEWGFPYQGQQRATLMLRKHPTHGSDVIFQVERGQLLCRFDGCNVKVRFGDREPVTYSASEPDDHSSEVLFIRNYSSFVKNVRAVSKVVIQVNVYQQGAETFTFDVGNLKF